MKIIESEQVARCFDCGRRRKIYAVQTIAILSQNDVSHQLKPTCKTCYELQLTDIKKEDDAI